MYNSFTVRLTVAGILISRPMLVLLRTPESLIGWCSDYLRMLAVDIRESDLFSTDAIGVPDGIFLPVRGVSHQTQGDERLVPSDCVGHWCHTYSDFL